MNLQSEYMGLSLAHPLVASASPLSTTIDGLKRLEDGGAAAVVMFSLFEEQIRLEDEAYTHYLNVGTNSFAESLSYFPTIDDYHAGTESYLELLRRGKEALDIPLIASLNGVSGEGWTRYAGEMQQAGADAIELNVYHIAADPTVSGAEVEARYLDTVRAVKAQTSIPIALKLGPYFSATGHLALQLEAAGADALVLFNRFYQPDIDLDRLEVTSDLQLSDPHEIRLPLMWIAILYGHLKASLAASTGVRSEVEIIKYLMAGADVVMSTSALLRDGPETLSGWLQKLREWMEQRGYDSVAQMRGSMSQQNVADPTAFERANYIKILEGYPGPTQR